MKTLLNLTQEQTIFQTHYAKYAHGMLPLADKPLVSYCIDKLAAQGYQTIYIVTTDRTQAITKKLGFGSFWSLTIHYLNINKKVDLDKYLNLKTQGLNEIYLPEITKNNESQNLQDNGMDYISNLIDHYMDKQLQVVTDSNNFQLPSYQVKPNLFLSEGAQAQVMPDYPVHLGKFSQLDSQCIFRGPSVIGKNCVVARGNILDNTVVMPNTFVGSGLDLSNCLVTSEWIYHRITQEQIRIDNLELLAAA